ncbi:integrase core domain protein [Plakobranchus ocellatus]|uniref:Integrase core domain protein n=1 Tax=Plakobranchus ocellatus TaxID=259542 RepID=A0AAV4ATQ2_9GAST|nr:integrase core domain protein [Plakobranchus ocellatus]
MKSSTLIAHFKEIFARFGIPEKLISDNAANYTSQEFEEFLKNWDVDHITSSPRYPQSNGFAERMVQTANKLLAKSKEEDPHIALLNYKTSPSQNLPSPAELLMGRKLRTKLPSLKSHHQTKNSQKELKKMKENQRQQRKHHRGFDLQPLEAGDDVFMRNQADTLWTPAKFVKKALEPRSYILQQGKATYRRNRRQILKSNTISFQHPTSVTRDDEEDQFPDFPDDLVRHSNEPPTPTTPHVTSSADSNTADTQTTSLNQTDQNTCTARSGRRITKPKKLNLQDAMQNVQRP